MTHFPNKNINYLIFKKGKMRFNKSAKKMDIRKLYIKKQLSTGIRQWPINSYTLLMMIHKITPSVDYN